MALPLPEYDNADATELAGWIQRGEVSPEEALEAAVARVEARNPALNAVVTPLFDRAREQLKRLPEAAPFRGVPFLLKDLLAELKGTRTSASTRLRAKHVATQDTGHVQRLRAAGFVFMGKTNTPEFGIMGVTEPELHGPARNPWNPDHTPGGSSGGAGSAVGARMVPVAHAGDGGGSIRIPAAHCGLVGLKPSRGRSSLGPLRGESWGGMVQEHAVTRSVRDCAAMLELTSGRQPGDPYGAPPKERPYPEELEVDPPKLRVAFSPETLFAGESDPECRAAVKRAVELMQALGHEVFEARPSFDREALVQAYFTLVSGSVAKDVELAAEWAGVKPRARDFEAPTWFLAQVGWATSAATYARAVDTSHSAGRQVAPFFETECDVFITSTTARPAPQIGELAATRSDLAGLAMLRALPLKSALRSTLQALGSPLLAATPNTQLFNLTGQPAISLPLHWSAAGLPVGVQFATKIGGEGLLLRLAAQLERAEPWANRMPPGL